LTFCGLSGIIGKVGKPFRKDKEEHLKKLIELILRKPDFLLLPEGPNNLKPDMIGIDDIRQVIKQARNTIIFCRHKHLEQSIIEKPNGVQIINLDCKCLILEKLK
jgi:3',5'-cyclic-AMP phosphodiesterase